MNNSQLHYIQLEIIKKLALNPALKFNDLIIKGLESEHMNYHLKKLKDLGFVKKDKDKYVLTDPGKDYSNLMDDEIKLIEKQPKTSVLLNIVRKNDRGEIEHLLSRRLRQPYYGKVGRLSGKVRFGESFQQAAERELFEETGLAAKALILEEIYHRVRYRGDKTIIQDVIFYVFFIINPQGSLIEKLPYQENLWLSKKDYLERKDLDFFDKFEFEERFEPKILKVNEDIDIAKDY